jgi:UDP-3-O-[3-hydroxymyristoyl] glucosamine N-acyltransferase
MRNLSFVDATSLTVGKIADLAAAQLRRGTRRSHVITGVAPLDEAGPSDLTFCEDSKHTTALRSTRAGACFMLRRFGSQAPDSVNALYVRAPHRAFVTIMYELYPAVLSSGTGSEVNTISSNASPHSTAAIGKDVAIHSGAVIGPEAKIGNGTVICANVVIGARVRIGRNCVIGASSSITHSLIGNRVIVHAGSCIGHDSFGYVRAPRGHLKVPHIGRVVVNDDVEIGAGTTISRGTITDTVIGEGTKIDSQVHIGHNVRIGRFCAIAAQCGFAGSVEIRDFVQIAGQVGIADRITIGEGAIIGPKSLVITHIPAGERWQGNPAMPGQRFFRCMAILRRSAASPVRTVR